MKKSCSWKYIIFLLLLNLSISAKPQIFEPGKTWLGTDGKPIEAHGGGILKVGDVYYWYGENHALGEGNKTGISCYSSKDLFNWKNEGVVLPKENVPAVFRDTGVCERPKVLYNAKTKKYVMWMHLDANQYTVAMAGVAVADSPTGKFNFLNYKRPIHFDYGYPKEDRVKGIPSKEKELGNTFRDMALFQDDDGKAYLFYSSEELATLYVVRLNEDFTDIEQPVVKGKTWERILTGTFSEAPAPFKFNHKYYLFASGTSGWEPNPSKFAVSDSIFGKWKILGNPCIGSEAELTFRSQSTFVFPAPRGPAGSFIYMGDRWNGKELEKSTYVWLPFCLNNFDNTRLVWFDKWDFSIFNSLADKLKAPVVVEKDNQISWEAVENAHAYKIFKNGKFYSVANSNKFDIPNGFNGVTDNYTVQAWNITGKNSPASNTITKTWNEPGEIYLSDKIPEYFLQGWGNLQKDRSIQLPKINIAGRKFNKGLGTHANSEIVYRIGGNYSKFSAWIGVDYFPKFSDKSSIQFEVWSDGEILYRSKIMKVTDTAQLIEIDITGTNELKLIVNDADDGTDWDHADWAEAKIK